MKTLILRILDDKSHNKMGYESANEMLDNESVYTNTSEIDFEFWRDPAYQLAMLDDQINYIKNYIQHLETGVMFMIEHGPIQVRTSDNIINVMDQLR